jgi:DNA polymerase
LWLPSGRSINYYKPKADWKMTPWGEDKLHFSYEGRRPNGSWGQVHSHPGKIVENVVQALARDILAVGLLRAEAAGLDVRLHVHDQIVAVTREEEKDEKLALLVKCLTDPISWVPDIPLKAGGFWSRVFMKEP